MFLECANDFKKTCDQLTNNKCEFFSHDSKSSRPYKAILSGIDNAPSAQIKNSLNELGLKCIDVKAIERTTRFGLKMFLYIVYFENKSITLQKLKHNYCFLNYYKVRWEHKSKPAEKLTQCHKCQLYGHGSKYCNVNTLCAYCAGSHNTQNCPDPSKLKCANCKGLHSSMDSSCPCRATYASLIKRRGHNNKTKSSIHTHNTYEDNYPNTLNHQVTHSARDSNMQWSNLFSTSNTNNFVANPFANINESNHNNNFSINNNLFSLNEINALINDVL